MGGRGRERFAMELSKLLLESLLEVRPHPPIC